MTTHGTASRLLLTLLLCDAARTTVHFQTISDKFAPHDALFNVSAPSEINDQTLSSSCSSQSPSSTPALGSSLKGIKSSETQEQSKEPSCADHKGVDMVPNQSYRAVASAIPQGMSNKPAPYEVADIDGIENELLPYSSKQLSSSNEIIGLKAFLKTEPPLGTVASGHLTQVEDNTASETSSQLERPIYTVDGLNQGSHGVRPSTSEFFKSGLATLKPKNRFFPRPVTDPKVQSPHSSATARQKLPPGMRVKPAKNEDGRPKSSKSQKQVSMTSALAAPKRSSRPGTAHKNSKPQFPPTLQAKAAEVSASGAPRISTSPTALPLISSQQASPLTIEKKAPASITDNPKGRKTPSIPTRSSILSPEKQRLMKALQLRRKQQIASDLMEEPGSTDGSPAVACSLPTIKTDSGVAIEELRKSGNHDLSLQSEVASDCDPAKSSPDLSTPSGSPRAALSSSPLRPNRNSSGDSTSNTKGAASRHSSPMNRDKDLPALPMKPESHPTAQCDIEVSSSLSRGKLADLNPANQPTREWQSFQQEDAGSDTDDALYEELRTAKFEQARKMSISPPPVQGARAGSHLKLRSSAESNGARLDKILNQKCSPGPAHMSQESTTTGEQDSGPAHSATEVPSTPRRSNLSQGLSRRINALAEMSKQDVSDQPSREPSSPFASRSFYETPTYKFPQSSSDMKTPTWSESTALSPRPQQQLFPRGTSFDSQRSSVTQRPSSRGGKKESVSVTAHIVRHYSRGAEGRPSAIEEESIGLQPNRGAVGHHPNTDRKALNLPRSPRNDRSFSFLSSRPSSRDSSRTTLTRQSLEAFRTLGRRQDGRSRPATSLSNASLDRVDEVSEGKSSSRASRLFKRLSIASTGRPYTAEVASAPVADETGKQQPFVEVQKPSATVVGDLMVQFPDSLVRTHGLAPMASHSLTRRPAGKAQMG